MLPLVLWAILQAVPGMPVPAVNRLLADCSGDHNAQSCRSFNEVVEHQDKELIKDLSTNAYVCFRQEADVFFVISFQQPVGSGHVTPRADYHLFKNGISDDFRIAYGNWQKAPNGSYVFRQLKASEASALITEDEIHFGYSFKNAKSQVIHYSAQIRRSTLRFSEHYEYPSDKGKGHDLNDITGSCQEFAPSK